MAADYQAWRAANPALAALLDGGVKRKSRRICLRASRHSRADAKIATRKAGSDVLQPVAAALPLLVGGSRRSLRLDAQLHRSSGT